MWTIKLPQFNNPITIVNTIAGYDILRPNLAWYEIQTNKTYKLSISDRVKQVSKVLRMCLAERWAPGRMTCALTSFCRAHDEHCFLPDIPTLDKNSGLWKVVLEMFQNDLENWRRESCFTRTMLLHTSLWLQWPLGVTVALNWLIILHYSSDISPSDYILFTDMKKYLAGKQYRTDVKGEVSPNNNVDWVSRKQFYKPNSKSLSRIG